MYDWADLRYFRYLLTILERQGFRAAAEELHISQPSLTVQARKFQENASVRLFQKTKSGRIRPTEAGVAFISLARLLLETREEVMNALVQIERGEIGSVRFGCAPLVDQRVFRDLCSLHKEILPQCSLRPTHGDTDQLAEEVARGQVDAAVVTLPLRHPELRIEEIRRDRLVACLRHDDPLARKPVLNVTDLQGNLTVFYHPQRHPDAHEVLVHMLASAGITIDECSLASHPSEMQMLVKEGHGLTLIREGSRIDDELTIRPIADVTWTVDTAVIYHKQRHPKTVPILVKKLRRQFQDEASGNGRKEDTASLRIHGSARKPPQAARNVPVQLTFLDRKHGASKR
ncbi:DNA-binding transcriptional LysR family regulator [Granulicella aggregans]|uniref:DNA-binding transcriptional LysR family regulator n=1 Tax=Granulicella aggregans TaxID=474949 RepID=A0A7W7ZHL9_9BACT|nr:LysR family transcriptional regulator [Granulicella aggregans]MBB5060012.1 DNA-binding transcriptional LysR family regulator [Granulicella aggregans]